MASPIAALPNEGVLNAPRQFSSVSEGAVIPTRCDLAPTFTIHWPSQARIAFTRHTTLDPSLLMWDMRRNIVPASLPDRRCVVHFIYPELSISRKLWWLVIEGGKVDLCYVDPGYEVDLYVRGSLRSMTSVWMGVTTLRAEIDTGNVTLTGDKAMARSMSEWLGLSPFAKEKSRISG